MKIEIVPCQISGKISAPPSKSWTHRALILAALAKGKSKIIFPLVSEDTEATLNCLQKIGVKIKKGKNFWEVEGGNFLVPKEPLFCRESGTTLRLMTGVCALVKGRCILTGERALMKRPIEPLISALKKLGVKCSLKKNLVILENNFIGGKTKLKGDVSSQFVSALLLISPLAKKEVEIKLTTPLESKAYALMTIEAQKKFGVRVNYSKDLRKFSVKKQNYRPTKYLVEGDWSSVAPFLAAGAIAGRVGVKNLNLKSLQPDREILNVLKKMEARVIIKNGLVLVEKSELKPLKFNVKDCPDLFPIICVLSALARGKSEISGIERLRLKESNRLEEMSRDLKEMGIKNYFKKNKFFVGRGKPKGGIIETRDHRIAMSFAILGLVAQGKTIIKNAQCVSKSFPEFFEVLNNLMHNKDYRD